MKVSPFKTPVVQQDDDYEYDGYVPLKIPFTETERYNYYDQFLQGLQLENYFDYASECIEQNFGTLDDYAYYQNNVTLSDWWFDRFLNLTGAVGNFSDTIPDCYQFYFSFKTSINNRAEAFDYSWGNYALAFMFNQMGNAIAFQQIFQTIGESRENQMFEEIYYQYGVLIRLVFDFLPLEDGSL